MDENPPRAAGPAFVDAVTRVIRALPAGEVATYGEVAREAGYPGAARAVGNLLASGADVPWWRVVAANGRLVPGNEAEHTRRLTAEGVPVRHGRVCWPHGRCGGTMGPWMPRTSS